MSNGDGGGNGGSPPDPFSGLDGLLQVEIAELLAAFESLIQILQAVFKYLWGLLSGIITAILNGLKAAIKGLRTLVNDLYNNVIKPLIQHIQEFFAWLRRITHPLIKYLVLMRSAYDQYFNKIIKPVIVMIQRIRQILVIFKVFHVKWAVKLDSTLASLQARIFKNFETLRQHANQIVTWVSIALDPFGFIKHDVFAASFFGALSDLVLGLTNRPLAYYQGNTHSISTMQPVLGFGSTASDDIRAAANGADNVWGTIMAYNQGVAADLGAGQP